ncbi:predicted protein [Uncinocarpus reesii 1704]|uniref:U1-type domain-containing protein n=1 Tax=Uncinocarpus reesii (strain UAMH 1704) TaxID=336963 RepID=C4JS84_UNCRE|nr:uncharacterized protein UREG_05323 [Uncinocarpus reesii 1704]EEP80481.1 predicted protein [Uncinocarpus reesii 1704]
MAVSALSGRGNSPTAGSFLRISRMPDRPRGFREALRAKYASEPEVGASSSSGSTEPLQISGKVVEEVGFDRVRKILATLQELRIVILDGMRIRGFAAEEDEDLRKAEIERVKELCPKITQLDLSRNLLADWTEIADLSEQLEDLRILKLDGNRFSISLGDRVLRGITELHLDETLLTWEEISALSYRVPDLRKLSLSSNNLPLVSVPISNTITDITLESNNFTTIQGLSHLSSLPNLTRLSVRRNKISVIQDSNDKTHPLRFSPTVTTLDISRNLIESWAFIDALPSVFPGLTNLRISDNPVYEQPPASSAITGLPEKRMTVDEAYMLTLARLPKLEIMNYSKITPQDRVNGELYYMSLIKKELSISPVSEEKRILSSHPQYGELCAIHGAPEIKRAESNDPVNIRSLAARLINFTFYFPNAKHAPGQTAMEFRKEIPRTFDIYRVKAIVARHFSLAPLSFRLIWETEEWDPVEEGVAEEDEWDSGDEGDEEPVEVGRQKRFVRREEEFVDSTRAVEHWLSHDTREVRLIKCWRVKGLYSIPCGLIAGQPKYWCKHCKTYVRDTPFERTQHEATGKHQGSLKRFLRDVHRSQDKDQRESQRAKQEVERLKGLVGHAAAKPEKEPPWKRGGRNPDVGASASLSVTKEQRKRQMEQLAEMGVAIPEEFRPEMAMVGEWKTLSETPVAERETAAVVKGVRKRKLEDQEEDEEDEAGGPVPELERPRKVWGSAFKSHPVAEENDDELEALLSMTKDIKGKNTKLETKSEDEAIKEEEPVMEPVTGLDTNTGFQDNIKREEVKSDSLDAPPTLEASAARNSTPPVVFKKRKPKQAKR